MFKNCLDDVGVIVDPKLIRDGQKQCVGLGDSFVFRELLDEEIPLGGVAAAKNGSCVVAEEADIVLVLVVHECKDAAADRYPRLARM